MKRRANPDEVEAGTCPEEGGVNAGPLDLVIIVKALHFINQYRVGQVIARLPPLDGDVSRVWWICEFSRPVQTPVGWMHFCCVEDRNLRRVGAQVKRFRYPRGHYELLPLLAKVTSPKYASA